MSQALLIDLTRLRKSDVQILYDSGDWLDGDQAPEPALRASHPSQRARTTDAALGSPVYLTAEYSVPVTIDTVALLYGNLTPTPNLLKYSEDFGQWTPTGMTVTEDTNQNFPIPETLRSFELDEGVANSEHKIALGLAAPSADPGKRDAWTSSLYVTYDLVRYVRLDMRENGEEVTQIFDLQNGVTSGSLSVGANWANGSASIVPVSPPFRGGETWYRIQITADRTANLDTSVACTFRFMDTTGVTTGYTGTNRTLLVAGAMVKGGAEVSNDYARTDGRAGAMFSVEFNDLANLGLGAGWRSAYREDLTDFFEEMSWAHSCFVSFDEVRIDTEVTINFSDPDNNDGFAMFSQFIAGTGLGLPDLEAGYGVEWVERTADAYSYSSSLFRPFRERFRKVAADWAFLNEDERNIFFSLDRSSGMSEGVLLAVDPAASDLAELLVYGDQDLSGTTNKGFSRSENSQAYSRALEITEVLP